MEYLTIDETCKVLKLNRCSIMKLINNGQLKASKIGKEYRIKRNDIDAMIEENFIKAERK